jgi:glutaredoxin
LNKTAIFLLLCSAGAHAELYKWVGPDGKVTYSDVPPPAVTKRVETRALAPAANSVALPYELAEAVKNNPVTLYVAPACSPCDQGRALLNSRGIPFAEKTVSSNEDIARLRQVGGDAQLPLLLVGSNRQQGFSESAWSVALNAAGYPETSKLPKAYRNPPPEAAAPAPKPATPRQAVPQQQPRVAEDVPAAGGNAPPGFRF